MSAALAAIAFSLSSTVRGEGERASTALDGIRGYYLAAGAVNRASMELLWSIKAPPDKRPIPRYTIALDYRFESGDVHVEFLPEAGKLNINSATPEQLTRLGVALGLEPQRAEMIAVGIDNWRRPNAEGSAADSSNPALGPSFRVLHASFQEIEELLQVQGVTPDIFYGTYLPAPAGSTLSGSPRLIARPGLKDCLSVYGAKDRVDANTAQPAVLAAVGLSPDQVNAVLQTRFQAPFTAKSLSDFLQAIGNPGALLRVEGNSILTIRATARLRAADGRLSDMRRTVAAQVKYLPPNAGSPIDTLRWYDSTWIN